MEASVVSNAVVRESQSLEQFRSNAIVQDFVLE